MSKSTLGENTAHLTAAASLAQLEAGAERSIALFQHASLLVKLYAPTGKDPQTPHTRDEIYVVAAGQGTFFNGTDRKTFGPGDLLFVSAGIPHRFENFSDDLAVWVMYFGPEGGEH